MAVGGRMNERSWPRHMLRLRETRETAGFASGPGCCLPRAGEDVGLLRLIPGRVNCSARRERARNAIPAPSRLGNPGSDSCALWANCCRSFLAESRSEPVGRQKRLADFGHQVVDLGQQGRASGCRSSVTPSKSGVAIAFFNMFAPKLAPGAKRPVTIRSGPDNDRLVFGTGERRLTRPATENRSPITELPAPLHLVTG